MNRKKISYIPFNLFFCLSSFFIPFTIITTFTNLNVWMCSMISLWIYLDDVKHSSTNDYLEDEIKKLKDNNLIK